MEICPFKIEVKEIYPFSKICSWRLKIYSRDFFPLKFCFGDLSFEDLGDLSFEKLLGYLSYWKFV